MLPAGLLFPSFFSQIYSCKKNGNSKRTECFSNDSTVVISVLSCLCKGTMLPITAVSLSILTSVSFWPLLIIESVARVSHHVLFKHDLLVKQV